MIERHNAAAQIGTALRRSRIAALLGPRQSGKTTLARQIVPVSSPNYFDLEDPLALSRLDEPMTALAGLKGTVVIDEVQRRPDLFPVLRVLADRRPLPARFLVLGSASPELLRQSSEALTGRLEMVTLAGFELADVGVKAHARHWLRGGFPRAFLARSNSDSLAWRRQFLLSTVERDLPLLGVSLPSAALMRFWMMLAHYHANTWNAADPARSLGVSEPTLKRYLDLLTGLFMIRQLQPWHENLGKRQVKSPKIYIRDSGLFNEMIGARSERDLLAHPKLGASWEGYVVEEILKAVQPEEAYFWATHAGAEIDLLLLKNGERYGVEIKRADAPRMTPSMRAALADLRLKKLVVVYPGTRAYSVGERTRAVPFTAVTDGFSGLFGAAK